MKFYGLAMLLRLLRRRSPCGERGLKLEVERVYTNEGRSLPVRGAWIEMIYKIWFIIYRIVAPRAGSVD